MKKTAPKKPSNVQDISYNPETQDLDVTFAGGRRYRYSGVDQDRADELKSAPSRGKYLHRNIIGKFDHTTL